MGTKGVYARESADLGAFSRTGNITYLILYQELDTLNWRSSSL